MKQTAFRLFRHLTHGLGGHGLGLRKIPGASRLYTYFYSKFAPEGLVLIKAEGQRMYVNAADEPLGRSLITFGTYEKYETDLFRSLVSPGMTVIDIGANVGYYSLIAAALVGDDGRVYAFEPDPGNYKILIRNIESNGYKNVTASQKAVADSASRIELFIDCRNFGNRSLWSRSIVHKGGSVEVETIGLDSFWKEELKESPIDVIKIDAQGAEGLIVKGARNLLQSQSPKIFMEYEPEMLRNAGTDPVSLIIELRGYGFDVKLIDYENLCLRPLENSQLLRACQTNGYIDLFLDKPT